jgi:AAA15 family ATPase/GTPase
MENFIDHISIHNFKSIRELKLDGLERINLFIGKPNVGKSNILEAFGVFSLPYLKYNSDKSLESVIRCENLSELFFDGDINKPVTVSTNSGIGEIMLSKDEREKGFITISEKDFIIRIENNGYKSTIQIENRNLRIITEDSNPAIKSYQFNLAKNSKRNGHSFLLPPSGANLMNVIEGVPSLKAEITNLFKEYGLKMVFDRASYETKIMKELKNDDVFLIPYSSIADTLQRIIFYKTAIASNQNSVLIFEEPEAHAFPPYIVHITHEIVELKSNQFILSTHSPYILDYFLENAIDELAIFMVDYKNGETVANKLTKEDLTDIRQYGIDLFTNYESFLK